MFSVRLHTFTLSEIIANRSSYLLSWNDSVYNSYSSTRWGFIAVRESFSGRLLGYSRRVSYSSYLKLG